MANGSERIRNCTAMCSLAPTSNMFANTIQGRVTRSDGILILSRNSLGKRKKIVRGGVCCGVVSVCYRVRVWVQLLPGTDMGTTITGPG